MRRFNVGVVAGIVLIAAGVVFLLQGTGILVDGLAYLWAVLFCAGGAVFLYLFVGDTAQWWAVIPGFTLVSIGLLIGLGRILPTVADAVGGSLVPFAIGASFWVIYFLNREHWWAIIPGGVMLSVALMVGLESVLEGEGMGGVLMLGMALTFLLLSFLATPQRRFRWALIPAAVLAVIGLVMLAVSESAMAFVFPSVVILVGVYLLVRVFLRRGPGKTETSQ